MDISGVIDKTQGVFGARRVFSDPVERDGTTVVFAARVSGGGGAGEGVAPGEQPGVEGKQSGTGAGFGLGAKPAGAFVIHGGKLRWQPAVDVNRIIRGGQMIAAIAVIGGIITRLRGASGQSVGSARREQRLIRRNRRLVRRNRRAARRQRVLMKKVLAQAKRR